MEVSSTATLPKAPDRGIRVSISVKFLMLIVSTLVFAVTAVVVNAIYLFKKDNINNIYLTSEILTSSKANEIRFWIDSVLKRGTFIGAALSQKSGLLDSFKNDKDIICATIYSDKESDHQFKNNWLNAQLAAELSLTPGDIEKMQSELKPRWNELDAGLPEVSLVFTPSHVPVLIINTFLTRQVNGQISEFLSLGIQQKHLTESLSDTGPYRISLINNQGRILAHKNATLLNSNVTEHPLVRKMLSSTLQSEFQEFQTEGEFYLGAFSKLGFGGLGVVSEVPKAIAFETGDSLIKRSVLIALFISSLVFILAYFWLESLVSPIRVLQKATRAISKGNFDIQVEVKTRDEMLDLAQSFNEMGKEIQRKIDNLFQMNQASLVISSTLDTQKLLEYSVETLMGLIHCKRALAWYKGTELIRVKKNWFEAFKISGQELAKATHNQTQPALIQLNDTQLLVAAIREKSKISGYLILAEKENGKPFQEEDVLILGTILSSSGTTFENISLLKETAIKARMEKELETAKHVQDTMFPPSAVEFQSQNQETAQNSLRIRSYYTPAAECGGDWWGCAEMPDNKILLAIGDATGHGVPAAMVTATARATCSVLHSFAQHSPQMALFPKLMLHFLNKAVYESTQGRILMTFFLAVLDLTTGELTYATASHDPIYYYQKPQDATEDAPGDRSCLTALMVEPGPRLGQQPESFYEEAKVQLNPGDFILLYTDGIPEGFNPAHEEYGERKFLRSIVKHAHKGTDDIRDGILEDFNLYVEKEPLQDDITLAVCQYGISSAQASEKS